MFNRVMIGLMLLLAIPFWAQAEPTEAVMTPAEQRALVKQLVQAGLNETTAADMGNALATAQFTAEQGRLITRQLQDAAGDRFGREAMVSKVQEGLAKRVGPEAIVHALGRVRERHGLAKELARDIPSGNSAELSGMIADALSSGLRQEDARQLTQGLLGQRRQPGVQPLAMETMTTARDMVRLGVVSQTAAKILAHALEHGFDAAAMRDVRQTLSDQRAQSNMNQVAERMAAAIQNGVAAKDLAAHAQASGRQADNDKGSGGSGAGSGSGGSGGSGSGSGGSGSSGGGNGGSGGAGGASGGGGKGGPGGKGGHGGGGKGGGRS